MLISPEYVELNRELHARNPNYGTSGPRCAKAADHVARHVEAKTVLDYGCGKGMLKAAMERGGWDHALVQPILPYEILEYDPAVEGKTEKPIAADLVVCSDVLEHIEPECLDDVLDDLRNIAQRAVLLFVGTRPAKKTLIDGRNAHLIVKPSTWWLHKILERWELKRFDDYSGDAFMCVGEPI
jgi:hypothetical protein